MNEIPACKNWGVGSMSQSLRRVIMRKPGAILNADPARWHYGKPINGAALAAQYERFVALVQNAGVEIVWVDDPHLEVPADDLADSVFTYDPSFMTPAGAVLLALGKDLRRAEVALHRQVYQRESVPIIGEITGAGTVEGGDCFWITEDLLAVGRGFRTNNEGIEQLRTILKAHGIGVVAFDLPYLNGPQACLHLLSVISPLAEKLALVYAPLMPTALYQLLEKLGWQLLHAPKDEFEASSGLNLNVLATAPKRCIAVAGFDKTKAIMQAGGCEVVTFEADELCIPCEGGPTCLTRPLWREA